jgi:hypothetical protein
MSWFDLSITDGTKRLLIYVSEHHGKQSPREPPVLHLTRPADSNVCQSCAMSRGSIKERQYLELSTMGQ